MSKIAIIGSTGFVGSSLVNYTIQNSRSQILSIDSCEKKWGTKKLHPAIDSRSRHSLQVADVRNTTLLSRLFELEECDIAIYNSISALDCANETNKMDSFLTSVENSTVSTIAILAKDDQKMYSMNRFMEHHVAKKWLDRIKSKGKALLFVGTCEAFGPKQEVIESIPSLILSALEGSDSTSVSKRPREWIYIKDLYNRLNLILAQSQPISGYYFINSGQENSEADMLAYIKSLVEKQQPERLKINYMFENTDRRCTMNYVRPIYEALEHSLESTIGHTTAWYSENRMAATQNWETHV